MKLRAYITHKKAENYSDCADYFRISTQHKRVAVSDGVSQSIMPLEWAKILVTSFLERSWEPNQSIIPLQQKWYREALSFLDEQRSQGKNPWMLENCLMNKDGAGATFCGVTFKDESHWQASILGDSCLVLLDENNEIKDIISSKEGKFDNRPDYFDSFKEHRGTVHNIDGELRINNIIFLVSDPFSELFQIIQKTSEEKVVVEKLLSLKSYEEYLQLVDDFREYYHMHNDDSTLVIIEFDGNEELSIVDECTLEFLLEREIKAKEDEEKRRNESEQKEEELLWEKACEINTKDSYLEYLRISVLAKYKKIAEEKISEISSQEEQSDWENAKCRNSFPAYNQYLRKYPKGLYSQEAKCCIEKLNNRSSESGNGNSQENQPEPSSEESDKCRRENNISINPTILEGGLEMDGKNEPSKAENDKPKVSKEQWQSAGAEPPNSPDCTSKCSEFSAESSSTTFTTSTEGKDKEPSNSDGTKGKEPELSIDNSATVWGAGGQEKMAKQKIIEESDEIIVPNSVNAVDGIDREEFRALLSTANQLFIKHSSSFKKALADHKWRNSLQMSFQQFWLELEKIIYNDHG